MRVVAESGRRAFLLGDAAGIDLKGGSEIGLSNEIVVHRAQHGGGIGGSWGRGGVCGNNPGSKWQEPEGKFSHESKPYFDGVMAPSRGSSRNIYFLPAV